MSAPCGPRSTRSVQHSTVHVPCSWRAVRLTRTRMRRWRCYIKGAGKPGFANKWSGNGWEPGEGFDCDYKVPRD